MRNDEFLNDSVFSSNWDSLLSICKAELILMDQFKKTEIIVASSEGWEGQFMAIFLFDMPHNSLFGNEKFSKKGLRWPWQVWFFTQNARWKPWKSLIFYIDWKIESDVH